MGTTAEQEGGYEMNVMDYARKYVHPDDAGVVGAETQKALETTDPNYFSELESRSIRADGTEIVVLTKLRVLKDSNGRTIKLIGANQDITDRKRAEEERDRWQQQVIEAQRQALQDLSTPIIPIMDGIVVMPLVGAIDTTRSRDITRALLQGISQYRAKIAILDVTGVPIVDSGVADHLNRTIQAARLKGAQTIVTGITDAVAETIVDLGIDWGSLQTLPNLQAGLLYALEQLGIQMGKQSAAR